MKQERVISLLLSLIMIFTSCNLCFAEENIIYENESNNDVLNNMTEIEKESGSVSSQAVYLYEGGGAEEIEVTTDDVTETTTTNAEDKPYAVEGGNIYYGLREVNILDENNRPVSIKRWEITKGDKSVVSADIPAVIDGNKIEAISSGAFMNNTELKSVKISEGIDEIESSAFSGCSNLSNVELPKGLKNINEWAFLGCISLGSVDIPASIEIMSVGCFGGCTNLKSINVDSENEKFETLDGIVFSKDKTKLVIYPAGLDYTEYKIPEGIVSTYSQAFNGTAKLKKVILPDSMTIITSQPLTGCESVTSVKIPETATELDTFAFARSGLIEVEIPDSVERIGTLAFHDSLNLKSVKLPKNLKSLGIETFENCKSLMEIKIPEGLKTISVGTFRYCDKLKAAEIPRSVETIDKDAFLGCKDLTIYCYKDSYAETYAKENNFKYCYIGEDGETIGIVIDKSKETIYINDSFQITASLFPSNAVNKNIIWESDNPEIATVDENGIVKGIAAGTTVVRAIAQNGGSFAECSVTVYKNIDENANSYDVEDGKIYYNPDNGEIIGCDSSVRSAVIPSVINGVKITGIGNGAFSQCRRLNNVVIPEGASFISNMAFSDCKYLKNITIPKSIRSIGNYAFNKSGLTNINIPSGVVSIGENAFFECQNLISVNVDSRNTVYASDDGVLFNKNKTKLIHYPASLQNTEYVIPEGVTSISEKAFSGAQSLKSVEIPSSMTNISDMAFYNCVSLTDVKMPENVTNIGEKTFYNCKSLRYIEIPKSVTSIDSYAFLGCINLMSIEISENVTSIGNKTFSECENLVLYGYKDSYAQSYADKNYIPFEIIDGSKKVLSVFIDKSIADVYINYDIQLKAVVTPSNALNKAVLWESEDETIAKVDENGIVTGIKEGKTVIKATTLDGGFSDTLSVTVTQRKGIGSYEVEGGSIYYDFATGKIVKSSKLITSAVIPPVIDKVNITGIDEQAFENRNNLKKVVIPEGAVSIGENAFSGCNSLTDITIPDSVTDIEALAFQNCSSLTSINIPKGVSYMGDFTLGGNIFAGCSELKEINVDSENPNYTSDGGVLFNKDKTEIVIYPVGIEYESYVIPSGVTSIHEYAFEYCLNLKSVEIPESMTSISQNAFSSCNSLTDVKIPESVTSIDAYAFNNCKGIVSMKIPESITSIGEGAFKRCTNLTIMEIPENVTNIGEDAFSQCENLTLYVYKDSYAQNYAVENNIPFKVIENNEAVLGVAIKENIAEVDVSDSLQLIAEVFPLSALNKKVLWESEDNNIVSVDENGLITGISEGKAVVKATTEEGGFISECKVFVYRKVALYDVEGGKITYDTITGEIISCDESVTSAVIPDTINGVKITGIEEDAFSDCINLTDVKISEGITNIADWAFSNCQSLKIVEIPKSVINIGEGAFHNCINLQAIEIPEETVSIGEDVFTNCSNVTMYVSKDSYAQNYAVLKSIPFKAIDGSGDILGVIINANEVEIVKDDSIQLTAVVMPSSAANKSVVWESNDPSIASVDENGIVIGVSTGKTDVKASSSDGNVYSVCSVTIIRKNKSFDAEGGKVYYDFETGEITGCDESVKSVVIADSYDGVKITGIDSNAFKDCQSLKSVEISEGITNINELAFKNCQNLTSIEIPRSVNNIMPDSFSECPNLTIYCYNDSYAKEYAEKYNLNFEIMYVGVSGIKLDNNEADINLNDTLKLTAVVSPENAVNKNIIWESSDDSIASVDENGVVTANALGSAVIKATTEEGGFSDECVVNVTAKIPPDLKKPEPGDVDGVDGITINDAALVLQYVLNNDTTGFAENGGLEAAKVTNGKNVTAEDASIILQKALKSDFVMPIEVKSK